MYFLVRPRLGLSVTPTEPEEDEVVVVVRGEREGPQKVNGDARRPMRKAREKLSVASVARNMPSNTSDIHCVRRSC